MNSLFSIAHFPFLIFHFTKLVDPPKEMENGCRAFGAVTKAMYWAKWRVS